MTQGYDPFSQLRSEIQRALQSINGKVNDVAAFARGNEARLQELQGAMDRVTSIRQGMSAPGVVRIEDLPGRRVPFVLLVEIPVLAGSVTTEQRSVTISQDGPFVAVRRMATFQSFLEYRVSQTFEMTTTTQRYSGRSYGRFRPIHSAWDVNDAGSVAATEMIEWQGASMGGGPGAGVWPNAVIGTPSNRSPFRTMEFDGYIETINAGSSYPRQNIPVPTSMWTTEINAPMDLGCLDFFERGETITFKASPSHTNNPNAGNVEASQYNWISAGSYPFLAGQYDCHEGIVTPIGAVGSGTIGGPIAVSEGEGGIETLTTDPVVREPNGVLILGFEGYRIIQPVAP